MGRTWHQGRGGNRHPESEGLEMTEQEFRTLVAVEILTETEFSKTGWAKEFAEETFRVAQGMPKMIAATSRPISVYGYWDKDNDTFWNIHISFSTFTALLRMIQTVEKCTEILGAEIAQKYALPGGVIDLRSFVKNESRENNWQVWSIKTSANVKIFCLTHEGENLFI